MRGVPERAHVSLLAPVASLHNVERMDATTKNKQEEKKRRGRPTVSARLADSSLVELLYRREEHRTLFAVCRNGLVHEEDRVELPDGKLLIPYSPENNLITHRAILLPSSTSEYQAAPLLEALVRGFIHRYVDLPPDFEEVASWYVLFSWRFDDFTDLPYLRVQGDYGSGKSRFLKTVGSICYRPIFASGASTVSPLFRILDSIGGTLVLDEGDFRFSDEKADIVKILNNGNSTGFPVLRTESTPQGEFNPRAFNVFGPKLIATRGPFEDPALESRCITHRMDAGRVREGIPTNLLPEFHDQALAIRNQLLMYRMREAGVRPDLDTTLLASLEPRIAQVFAPLLSSIGDPTAQRRVLVLARRSSSTLADMRGESIEAEVVGAALAWGETSPGGIAVKAITESLAQQDLALSPRAVGAVLRRLGLRPRKRQGNYVLPGEEMGQLKALAERFGLLPEVEVGDVGDE
jgi:hypothetical protein